MFGKITREAIFWRQINEKGQYTGKGPTREETMDGAHTCALGRTSEVVIIDLEFHESAGERAEYPFGGYEPSVAQRGYGHPAPFAPEAGEMIAAESIALLNQLFKANS